MNTNSSTHFIYLIIFNYQLQHPGAQMGKGNTEFDLQYRIGSLSITFVVNKLFTCRLLTRN